MTTATLAPNPLHTRANGCYLDIAKPQDASYWVLEIDFIHSTHQPDATGMSLLFQACILAGANQSNVTKFGLSGSCYSSAHFKSRRQALRASNWIASLVADLYRRNIGLVERGTNDPLQKILFDAQPNS